MMIEVLFDVMVIVVFVVLVTLSIAFAVEKYSVRGTDRIKKRNAELWDKCVKASEEGYALFINGVPIEEGKIVLRALNQNDWNYGISCEKKELYFNADNATAISIAEMAMRKRKEKA